MKGKGNGFLLIVLLIVTSFAITTFISVHSLSSVLDTYKTSVIKLISTNVYDTLENKLLENVTIVRTMGKNKAVSDLLAKDNPVEENVRENAIKDVLLKLQVGMGIESLYVVSDTSHICYTANGKKSVIDTNVEQWYNNCINNTKDFAVSVQEDAEKAGKVSVLINNTIRDSNNAAMGVCGMVVDISSFQTIMQNMESEYGIVAYVVDEHGHICLSGDPAKIGEQVDFEYAFADSKDKFNYSEAEINGSSHSYMSRGIDDFNLYLIVIDNEMKVEDISASIVWKNIIAAIIILLLVLIFTRNVFFKDRKKLEVTAYRDKLTGLYNRNYIKRITDDKQRLDVKQYKSIAIIDIDRFKEENDSKGHVAGDNALRIVAYILKNSVQRKGVIMRWGGDEFVIIFNMNVNDAGELCEGMRQRVENEADVTISVGVAGLKPRDTLTTAIDRADKVLYQVKEAGRNKVFMSR